MLPSAAGLRKAPAAPSLSLLRWLRHGLAQEQVPGKLDARCGIRDDGAARSGRHQHRLWTFSQRIRPLGSIPNSSAAPHRIATGLALHWPDVAVQAASRRSYSSRTKPLEYAAVAHAHVEAIEEFKVETHDKVEHRATAAESTSNDTSLARKKVAVLVEDHAPAIRAKSMAHEVVQKEPTGAVAHPTVRITRHLAQNPTKGEPKTKRARKHERRRKVESSTQNWLRIWFRGNASTRNQVNLLRKQLRYLNPHIESVFAAYLNIPFPRIKHMPDYVVADLLKVIRQSQSKSDKAAERYFVVMDDMVASGIAPSVRDFTSALWLVGRSNDSDPKLGLDRALDIFSRMEQHGNRRAHTVTFNTLGDLTLRARRFDLFKKTLQQMSARELREDRFTCLLRLRYFGLIREPAKVKQTYRDMISDGHLIDTTVLNCVIKNLMISGDTATAEKTFERMKETTDPITQENQVETSQAWNHQQQLAKILQYSSWLFQSDSDSLGQLQRSTPTSPNTYTYRLIIRYHCFTTKSLHRIVDLLDEMQQAGLFITRPIFYMVFAGFSTNSSGKFSPWNATQLEAIFDLFVQCVKWSRRSELETHTRGEKFDHCCDFNERVTEAILQAFAEHTDGVRVRAVWKEIRSMWRTAALVTIEDMEALVESVESGEYVRYRDGGGRERAASKNIGWDEDDD